MEKTEKTMRFGIHLIFDGYGGDPQLMKNKEHLTNFLVELPKVMEMHTISEEVVVEVGPLNEKDPGGISGFVMIAESHISFHTFPNRGFVTADVYTCQDELDTEKLIGLLRHAFGVDDFDAQVIDRGLRYPSDNIQ